MTSSSLKKPQTTPRNTRSRSEAAAALAVALLCGAVAAAEEWRTFLRAPEALFCTVSPVIADVDAETVATGVSTAEPTADPEPDSEPAALPEAAEAVPAVAADVAAAEEPLIDLVADDADGETARKEPCAEESRDCSEALKRLREDRLAGIDLDIRVGGRPGNDYPCECRLEGETFEPRRFATTMFTWKAAGYCHKPLYFEDWQLERYGHSHGPLADPFFSAAHFFTTLPVLPYKMGVELPWECVYPLGYYRPGSCAPWTVPAIPISLRGMAVEAATVTGLVFLFP
jgi:hypothetical protein